MDSPADGVWLVEAVVVRVAIFGGGRPSQIWKRIQRKRCYRFSIAVFMFGGGNLQTCP